MQFALEAVPISDLKTAPNQVVEKIAEKPLMLTQNGRSIAVLVSPDEWNGIAAKLANHRFSNVEVEAIIEAYLQGDDEDDTLTLEEHRARMAERYGDVAAKV